MTEKDKRGRIDAYRVLGLRRALVFGEEEFREAYDRSAGEQHPDAGGREGAFARLGEAWEILSSPGRRLRHWLELGGGAWEAGGEVPADLLALFGEVGDLVMRVDGLLAKMATARSALGRSLLERESMELVAGVEQMRSRLTAMREREIGRFPDFEARGPTACQIEAAQTARTLLFLEKWDTQLRERWASLAA